MSEVFYRKYRPKKFSEVVGQEHVTTTLINSLKSGKTSHAYLFTGPRGTGKTSVARLLAKALNCTARAEEQGNKETEKQRNRETKKEKSPLVSEFLGAAEGSVGPCGKCDSCKAMVAGTHFDLIEIDAASTRGIDDVRELREKVVFRPAQSKYKIYILDEAHMLTNEAFNALLKTLEEPPEHSIFILCTTEPHRLPSTVISRCQRHDFKLADADLLIKYLSDIAKNEKVRIKPRVLELVVSVSGGSYRDAIGFLEQVISYGEGKDITVEQARKVLGLADRKEADKLINYITQKEVESGINLVNELARGGVNLHQFLNLVLQVLREELYNQIAKKAQVFKLSENAIVKLIRLFSVAEREMKDAVLPQLPIELVIIEFVNFLQREFELSESSLLGISSDDGGKSGDLQVLESLPEKKKSVIEDGLKDTKELSKGNPDTNSTRGVLLVKSLDEFWIQLLASIKVHNHSIEALLKGCQPKKLENNILTLNFFYKFHKERIEEIKNRHLIEKTAENILGKKVKVRCVLTEKTKSVPKDLAKEDLEETDLVQIAKEIFGGGIIE